MSLSNNTKKMLYIISTVILICLLIFVVIYYEKTKNDTSYADRYSLEDETQNEIDNSTKPEKSVNITIVLIETNKNGIKTVNKELAKLIVAEFKDKFGENVDCQIVLPPKPESGCCGVSALDNKDRRKPGEEDKNMERYPWLATLNYKSDDGQDLGVNCSGSLISSQYVLTAAHCVTGLEKVHLSSVRLGRQLTRLQNSSEDPKECSHTTTDKICSYGAVTIAVDKIIVHEHYNRTDLKNDIALIKLKKFAPFNNIIRPICLPASDVTRNLPESLKLDFVGWGWDYDNKSDYSGEKIIITDQRLLKELSIVNQTECQKRYSGKYNITHRHICAGVDNEGGLKACFRGDSGGSLMHRRGSITELVGVNSFGVTYPWCEAGIPAVFTNVHRYAFWIHSLILHDWSYRNSLE